MYATNYFEDKILKLAKGVTLSGYAAVYVGLFKNNPGESGSGTEIMYTGYVRKLITFSTPAPGTGSHSIDNTNLIVFDESHENAGTVTYIGIMDSLSGGNMLLYGKLDEDILVNNGVSPNIQIGAVRFTLSRKISAYYRVAVLNVLRGTTGINGFNPFFGCASGDVEGTGAEFNGNGYLRTAVTFSTPAEQASGVMSIQNETAVVSPIATAQWGSWSHTVVYDAETGGNVFFSTARSQSNTIYKGGNCGYNAGKLVLTVN